MVLGGARAAQQLSHTNKGGIVLKSSMPMQRVCCQTSQISQATILSPPSSLVPHLHLTVQLSAPPSYFNSEPKSIPTALKHSSDPDSTMPNNTSPSSTPSSPLTSVTKILSLIVSIAQRNCNVFSRRISPCKFSFQITQMRNHPTNKPQ
nr:hypothetical protein [Apium graveolens]QVJ98081.1 hypothetical protein [Apium graveolens]